MVMAPSNYNRDADYERTLNEAVASWEKKTKEMPQQDSCMLFVKTKALISLRQLEEMKAQGASLKNMRKVAERMVIQLNTQSLNYCAEINRIGLGATATQISELRAKTLHFQGKEQLFNCLEKDPGLADFPFLTDKGATEKVAEIFANTERYDYTIDLQVGFAIEEIEERLNHSSGRLTGIQSVFSSAVRKCATEKPPVEPDARAPADFGCF